MKFLVPNVKVIDKNSQFNTRTVNILIEKGRFKEITTDEIQLSDSFIELKGECISGLWADPKVDFCDPGKEHREDLESGSRAAVLGGISMVGLSPSTEPALESKSQIQYINNRSSNLSVDILPYATITKTQSPLELSEMLDLQQAGAIGFMQHANQNISMPLLIKALHYSQITGLKLHVKANETGIITGAYIHEGEVNVAIGMRGMPVEIEESTVFRNCKAAEYTGLPLHISGVSSGKSLAIIRESRKNGTQITCDTSINNLVFTDKELLSFNTNFKLDPCLRSENDRIELLKGVMEGEIDVVVSGHQPLEEDLKKCELRIAGFGSIGVQTLFPALLQTVGNLETCIDVLSNRNVKHLGKEPISISVGNEAVFTLFNPSDKWRLDKSTNASKSENSVFWNTELKGKAIGFFKNGSFHN